MDWFAQATGKRGRQPTFADTATQFCLTIKYLFGLALRQTIGMEESLLRLIGLDSVFPISAPFPVVKPRKSTNLAAILIGPVHCETTVLSGLREEAVVILLNFYEATNDLDLRYALSLLAEPKVHSLHIR